MLRRLTTVIIFVIMLTSSAWAGTWELDATHSALVFKIRHLVISNVAGSFGNFSGTLDWSGEEAELSAATVTLNIDAASISTDNENRDEHLKNEDFFDVPKFPNITFASTEIVPGQERQFELVGQMTMKGISKEVTFDCTFNGQAEFRGSSRVGFSAVAQIDRTEFGMDGSGTFDGGGLILGNTVSVTMDLEFVYVVENPPGQQN